MKRNRILCFSMMLAFILAASTAAAEITIPVNDNNTGIFDQPSVAMDGSVAHVAFIGDNNASGTYRVFYAAVNGDADFTNLSLPRDNTVIFTLPTAIDNGDLYYDARHPKIAVRSSTELVILFQAKPSGPGDDYRPYLARVTLAGHSVQAQSVQAVSGFPTGDIEDLSFGLVTSDNSARAAFARKTSIGAAEPFQVYFSRLGLDNALVVGSPLPLSSGAPPLGSNGSRPLPSLKLDDLNRAHVAWAANDTASTPNGTYYAMIQETNGLDNVLIAATEVLSRSLAWEHPNLLVENRSSIVILAADGSSPGFAGSLGMVRINPDADDQNGTPAYVGISSSFLLTPPGQAILPSNYNLWRPEAFVTASAKIHITGYGNFGTRGTYYSFQAASASPYVEMLTQPAQVGSEFPPEYPEEIGGDYSHAAIGFLNGKVVIFWSGELSTGGNRNLDVTALSAATEPIPFDESGCSASGTGRGGDGFGGGIPLLLIPAALLLLRRRFRRHVVG